MTLIFVDIWTFIHRNGTSDALIGEVMPVRSRHVCNALHPVEGLVITDVHI